MALIYMMYQIMKLFEHIQLYCGLLMKLFEYMQHCDVFLLSTSKSLIYCSVFLDWHYVC